MKDTLKLILKIAISLALLVFVFSQTGIDKTLERLSSANLWYIPVGVLIYLLSQWVSAYRWRFLSAVLGFHLSLREFYDYYLMGMYFNLFLPGAIGGDVGRMLYLAKSCDRKKREALLTLLAERGVGLAALLLLTGFICLTPAVDAIPWSIRAIIIGMSLAGLTGFLVVRLLPLERWAERFPKLGLLVQAQVYWQNLPLLIKSVLISLFVHGCMILLHVMVANALGIQVPVLYLAAVYGIVALVSVIPIAFNGIGVREGTYQFLLMKAGVPSDYALAFGLYWFLISTLTSLVGGLVLVKGHYKTPNTQDAELA